MKNDEKRRGRRGGRWWIAVVTNCGLLLGWGVDDEAVKVGCEENTKTKNGDAS